MFKLQINGRDTAASISRSEIRELARLADQRLPVRIIKKGKPCLGLMAQAGLIASVRRCRSAQK